MNTATIQVFDALNNGLLDVDRLMEAVSQGIHKAKVHGVDYEELRPYVLLELSRMPELLIKSNPYAFSVTFAHRRAVDFLRQMNAKRKPKEVGYLEAAQIDGIESSLMESYRREKAYQAAALVLQERFSEDLPFLNSYHELEKTGARRTRYSRLQSKFETELYRNPFRASDWLRLERSPKIAHSDGIVAGGSIGIGPDPDTHPKLPVMGDWPEGEPSRHANEKFFYSPTKQQRFLFKKEKELYELRNWQSCDPSCQRSCVTPPEMMEKIDKKLYFLKWLGFSAGNPIWQIRWRHPWHSMVSTPAIRQYLDWSMPLGNGGFGEKCDENGNVPVYHPRSKKHGVQGDPGPSLAPDLVYKYKYGPRERSTERTRFTNGVERHSAIALRKYNEVIEQINTPIRNPEPLALNIRTKVKVWLKVPGRDLKYQPFRHVTTRARLTAGNNWVVKVDKRTVLVSSLDWPRKPEGKLAAKTINPKMQVIKGTTLRSGEVIPPKRLVTQPVGRPGKPGRAAEKLVLSAVPESVEFKTFVLEDRQGNGKPWNEVGITKDTRISLLSPTHMRRSHYHVCDREARFCTAKGQHVLGLTKGVTLLDS